MDFGEREGILLRPGSVKNTLKPEADHIKLYFLILALTLLVCYI